MNTCILHTKIFDQNVTPYLHLALKSLIVKKSYFCNEFDFDFFWKNMFHFWLHHSSNRHFFTSFTLMTKIEIHLFRLKMFIKDCV